MVKKKLLTVDDLVMFCKMNNLARFSSKESGYPLAVQVPATFEVEDVSDDNHRGMLRLKFRILHDGLNRNGSFVSRQAANKASSTIADRPIMASIHQLDDGTWDFESHEMEIIENDEGKKEINYIEKQVGSFSSEKPFWEHDDELDRDYLCAYGYIAEEYTKAADIIRAKDGWTKNSCELVIEELAYNVKEKAIEFKAFYISASTLLGKRDDGTPIGEGMLGSRADIVDFSIQNNSVFAQNEQVIKLLSELNEKIDGLNINEKFSRKEEPNSVKVTTNTKDVKTTLSGVQFDGADDGGMDYYDPETGDDATGETNGETGGDNNGEPGNNDNPLDPISDDPQTDPQEPEVTEPSPEDVAAAEAVTNTIDGLSDSSSAADVAAARAAYDALSEDAKSLVTQETLNKLTAQETRIANQEAADAVIALIDALTDSSSAADVAAARAAYDALTEAQKSLISSAELDKLVAQEKRIEDQTAADEVTALITALTDESSVDDIHAARTAYDALTEDQKALISSETLAHLEEQEARIAGDDYVTDDGSEKKKKTSGFSVSVIRGGAVKTFSVSLQEKIEALFTLVNDTYSEADNDLYDVIVYEDTKECVMCGWFTGKSYRQSYQVKKGSYSLTGDRVAVKAIYVTDEEEKTLDSIRSNYSAIETELASFKSEPEKINILQAECYAQIADTDAFKKLCDQSVHFSMSVDEVQAAADKILLEFAKQNPIHTDAAKKTFGTRMFGNAMTKQSGKKSRYGNTFKK